MAYTEAVKNRFETTLREAAEAGLYKEERYICSEQGVEIEVEYPKGTPKQKVLNFCANNYLGLSSHPAVVEDEAERVLAVCRAHQAREFSLAADEEEALRMAAARRVAFTALARLRPTTILEDATVPRSAMPEMIDLIESCAERYNLQIGTFGHAGDGNLHPTFLVDERDADELARVEQAFGEMFAGALRLGGTISGEHGTGTVKMPFLKLQYNEPTLDTMRELKRVLDPRDLLNPGKVLEPGKRVGERILPDAAG